jgi:O-antigen/teichoic acid export membrane protein
MSRLREQARAAAGLGRGVLQTASANAAMTVLAGLAGVVLARSLGATVRGQYGAITAWYGLCLIVGELGLGAATTYFVARMPDRGADVVATTRLTLTGTGALALVAGLAAAPLLSHGSAEMVSGYRLMFACCLVAFVGAAFVFSLQAIDLPRWNLVRLTQPGTYLVAILILHYGHWLSLSTAMLALGASLAAQAALAYGLGAGLGLVRGRYDRQLRPGLLRYGAGQVSALLPALFVARLDQLVMSVTIPAAALGQYAVAASVTTLATPLVSALGYVAFPRLASRRLPSAGDARLRRLALRSSFTLAAAGATVLVVTAPWLVPLVFGPAFHGSVRLVWLLAPAGVFLACGQVCGDLLRGDGRPGAVARAQWAAAILTVVLLALLLTRFGASGAAVATTLATALALAIMLVELHRGARVSAAEPR